MIGINELRIGNLVNYGTQNGAIRIVNSMNEGIFDNIYIETGEEFEWTECSNIEPIPLNEAWLIKFGFLKRNGYGFNKTDFDLLAFKVADSIGYNFRFYGLNVEVKYVHQLQNLYFCLAGKELKIK